MTDQITVRTEVCKDETVYTDKRRANAIPCNNPETGTKQATTISRHHVTPISEQDAGMEVTETRPVWNDSDAYPMSLQGPETIPFTTTRTFPSSSTNTSFTTI